MAEEKSFKIISRKEARELGLKRFFSGKICPHGHVEERLVVNGTCLECIRIQTRKFGPARQRKNRVKITEQARIRCQKLRETNPEWVRSRKEYMDNWRSDPENKEKEKLYNSLRKK